MNKNFIIIIVFVLAFFQINTYSQAEKQNAKQLFVEAESFFLFEEYRDALPLYQKIARLEPDNYNVLYKIGICYLNNIYQKNKSIDCFEKASQHVNADYKVNSYREKGAPPEVLYYLGKAYRVNNKLDEAIKTFQQFKTSANPEEFDIELLDNEIASCQLAKKMMRNPIYYRVLSPSPSVNSSSAELNPIISGDGKTLVFTRQLQFYDGVFITYKDQNGKWSDPVNLTPNFGLDGNSLATGLSFNGDEIFVYRSDEYDGNIYSSKYKNKKWGTLEKLNENINTRFWESHASPSPDGQYLYFTSNRDGSYGGLDIYRSKREKGGSWGVATNLGPVINTSFNEESPFISHDGSNLYFCSQGHETMGGYDIFVSKPQTNGQWSKPKNMGYPLNTTDNDMFYSPSDVNAYGYLARFDNDKTLGLTDIYLVEVITELSSKTYTIKGRINLNNLDDETIKTILVKLLERGTNNLTAQDKPKTDGSYMVVAPQGSYTLLVEGKNIQPYTQNIELGIGQSENEIALAEVTLTKTKTETPTPTPTPTIEQPLAKDKSEIQPVEARNSFFAVDDSSVVPINLIVPKDVRLHIEISHNDNLVGNEDVVSTRKKYTYYYKPKPGNNLIKFTCSDPDGYISQTEVLVQYTPKDEIAEEILVAEPQKPVNLKNGLVSILTPDRLKVYLSGLNMKDFNDIAALYQHLLQVAEKEGFTNNEVVEMITIYFTQKSIICFEEDFTEHVTISDSLLKIAKDSSSIPLQYIERLITLNSDNIESMNLGLLKLLGARTDKPLDIIKQLNQFSEVKVDTAFDASKTKTINDGFLYFTKNTSTVSSTNALYLASTTEDLEYFYQNLLLASSDSLKTYLLSLSFSKNNIETAIALVMHLFANVDKHGYTSAELIKTLEIASANKSYYLKRFIDMLAEEAQGTLKAQLHIIDIDKDNIRSYSELIEYLLNKAQFKNYKRENLYQLLLELIGINEVQEFANKMKQFQDTSINRALNDAELTNYSSPLELIQYLLGSMDSYGFTEAGLYNLLLRMIFENGITDKELKAKKFSIQELWKDHKLASSIVLINVLLVILIVILYRNRKKKITKP